MCTILCECVNFSYAQNDDDHDCEKWKTPDFGVNSCEFITWWWASKGVILGAASPYVTSRLSFPIFAISSTSRLTFSHEAKSEKDLIRNGKVRVRWREHELGRGRCLCVCVRKTAMGVCWIRALATHVTSGGMIIHQDYTLINLKY